MAVLWAQPMISDLTQVIRVDTSDVSTLLGSIRRKRRLTSSCKDLHGHVLLGSTRNVSECFFAGPNHFFDFAEVGRLLGFQIRICCSHTDFIKYYIRLLSFFLSLTAVGPNQASKLKSSACCIQSEGYCLTFV